MNRRDWDDRYRTAELVWKAEPNQFVMREVSDLTPARALDVACGEGRNAIWLASQGWRVTGVDFSSVALDKARQLAEGRGLEVDWIEADITEWRPEPAAYDLVLLAYVHFAAPLRTALHRAMVGALRPGGRLLVIAHDSTNLDQGTGGPQSPEVLFSPDDVVADVADLGLATERAARVTRVVTTDQGATRAIDALVRLYRPVQEQGLAGDA